MLELNGMNINYEVTGQGQPVILLHGWGQNVEMMRPIASALSDQFVVYNIDLPGFGKSCEPLKAWTIYDYAEFLASFILHFEIEAPIIIGHSFGVRIAIIYASKYPTTKLVFTGGAGIRAKRGLDYYAKVYTYKLGKKIFKLPVLRRYSKQMANNAGSSDYQQASPIMKAVLINTVNEDLTPLLTKIPVPTLLFWGADDDATPLWMAKKMEQEIANAGLVVVENTGHFAYFERIDYFNLVVKTFLTTQEA